MVRRVLIIDTGVPATMRIQRLVTISTAALLCLTALTACGSGDEGGSVEGGLGNPAPAKNGGTDGSGGSDGDGKTGGPGLQKAGSMAKAAQIVNAYGTCNDISTDPNDDDFFPGDETYDQKWSVTERGACGKGTRIFMFKDLKTFQAAYKAQLDADRKESPNKGHRGKFLLGQDFAVLPDQKPVIRNAIKPGGLLILNCHPDFNPPTGYRKDPALVKGCVLTNYFED